ncbi:MAG: RidA family protein [Vicinamibacteraceae bacterium]
MRVAATFIGSMAAFGLVSCAHVADRPDIRFLNPPDLASSTQYTHVVETTGDRTVYVAGQVALDADGNLVGKDDLRLQARQVFENLGTALQSVGAGFGDVVKMTMYVTDMSELAGPCARFAAQVMAPPPAANMLVQVGRLAHEDFLLEIEAIAVLPE